jgi:hypothetical protein
MFGRTVSKACSQAQPPEVWWSVKAEVTGCDLVNKLDSATLSLLTQALAWQMHGTAIDSPDGMEQSKGLPHR